MEIEAKYRVPDEDRFQRLLAVDSLGGLRLGSSAVTPLVDLYSDTADRALLASGYACRVRQGWARPAVRSTAGSSTRSI
jgi:inorganic triphosphatase YgiF